MTETEFFQKYTGDGSSGNSAPSGGASPRRRTSPLEDYYNEKRQKQAVEKANQIINSDILHGGTKPVGWQPITSPPSGTSTSGSTSSRGRGHVGGLRDSYLDKHPDISTISSKDLPSANQTVYDLQQRKKELEGEKTKNARYSLVDGVLTNNNTDYDAEIADIDKRIAETKKQDDYRTVWDKLVDTVTGAVTGSAASKSDAMRTLYESGQSSRTAEYERELEQLQKDYDRAKRDYEETLELEGEDAAQWAKNTLDDVERKLNAYKTVVDENVQQKATQATADLADQLQQDSAEKIERAKDGSGAVGRFAVDAGVAATQMGIDALTGRALGIGDVGSKASMALRAFGGGTQEARQGGGDLKQQLGYGGGVAATEILTEMLTGGGLDMIYGEGFADKLVEKEIARMAKTDAGRTALRVLGSGFGEGVEEVISDAVNPLLRTIYNGKSIGENYSEEKVLDWLYDGLVGAALGVGGSAVNIATGEDAKKNAKLRSGEIDKAFELMTGKKASSEPQSVAETQGDITTPPAASNDAVTRPEKLNSTIYNNVETQNVDTQKNTAPNGTENSNDIEISKGPSALGANAKGAANTLARNISIMENDAPVASLSGKEMQSKTKKISDQIMDFFAQLGGAVDRPGFGDVELGKYGQSAILNHRPLNRAKMVSLSAVPEVIAEGKIISDVDNWKGRGYRSVIFAAPVEIAGERTYVAAVVNQFPGSNKFYLNECVDTEGNYLRINEVPSGNTKIGFTAADGITEGPKGTPPTLDGGSPEQSSLSSDVSSVEDISFTDSIPTAQQNVNSGQAENSGRPFEPTYNRNAAEPQREKLSQFWENTLQKSEAAAGTPEEVSQPLSYLPKTEKQSLAEAASRLSADRQGAIEKLINSEAWSGVQADTAWQVASDLYSEAAKTGNYEAYTSWRKVMDSHIIDTARGLQAQAKYTRHSGENALDSIAAAIADSKLTEAQQKALIDKVGKYATRFDNIARGMSDAPNAEAAKAGKPSSELVSLIEEMARERKTWTFKDNVYSDLLNKQNDTYLKEYAYRQLIAMGNDSLSTVSTADKVKAAQSLAQLSSIATFARNIGGNVTFGAVDTLTQNGFGVALDKLISKATGKRTVAVDKGWFSSEARKGSVDAMQKSILEVAGDVDMGGENRYGQSSGRAYKMTGSPVERFMSRWQQLMGYSLTTSDKFSRGGIEAEQMRGLNALKGSGLTDAEIQQLASTMADYRLFQNQGMAYKTSKALHDAFNVLGFGGRIDNTKLKTRQGGFGLGDLVNTYPGVPANLGVKALEYSPANVLKGGVELVNLLKSAKEGKVDVAKQQQAVMDISRGLAGVPAFALFAALTKAGFIRNWDDEDNKDVRAQNAAEGKSGIQVNLDGALRWLKGEDNALEWRYGDTLDSIGWLEPINAFMAIGSLMAQEPEDVSAWSYIGDIVEGSIQAFLDIPVVSNLSDMIDTLQYSNAETWTGKAAEAGITYLGNMATGFVPSPVRGIAKATDEYYRDTSGSTPTEAAWNSLIATIPGLRETLPKKLDNFGNEKMYSGSTAERLFNTLINPGDRTTIRQSDASAMLEKLREETGDAGIYPDRKAPKSVKYDDVESTLTPEQKREWQRTSGQLSEKLINDLKQVGTFDRLTPERQAEVVKSLNQLAKDTAMKQFVESTDRDYKSDYDDERALTAPAEFYTAKKVLSDTEGKKANFDAIDQVLKNFGHLKDDTQTALKASELNVNPLLYAQTKGIKSKSWYDTKAAVDKAKGTLGGTDNAIAIAVYNSMKGKSDEEILDAIRTQVTPDSGGQQSAVVRRAEAYTTVAKGNADLGSWLNLVAALHNADENSKPNKDEVYAAWRSLGLRDNQTYAGITRDDFYNIVKSSGSYATKDDYATQIDEDYAKIDPAVEKERTTFPTTPVTEETSKSNKTSMDDYYRALGLIK